MACCIITGIQTSGMKLNSVVPMNPRGATPAIAKVCPLILIVLPAMFGSLWNLRRQKL